MLLSQTNFLCLPWGHPVPLVIQFLLPGPGFSSSLNILQSWDLALPSSALPDYPELRCEPGPQSWPVIRFLSWSTSPSLLPWSQGLENESLWCGLIRLSLMSTLLEGFVRSACSFVLNRSVTVHWSRKSPVNWYYKPVCLFYSLRRQRNRTQVLFLVVREWHFFPLPHCCRM